MPRQVDLCRLIRAGIKDEREAQRYWRELSRSLPGDSIIKSIISRYIAEEELHENWLRKELEDCIAWATKEGLRRKRKVAELIGDVVVTE